MKKLNVYYDPVMEFVRLILGIEEHKPVTTTQIVFVLLSVVVLFISLVLSYFIWPIQIDKRLGKEAIYFGEVAINLKPPVHFHVTYTTT